MLSDLVGNSGKFVMLFVLESRCDVVGLVKDAQVVTISLGPLVVVEAGVGQTLSIVLLQVIRALLRRLESLDCDSELVVLSLVRPVLVVVVVVVVLHVASGSVVYS